MSPMLEAIFDVDHAASWVYRIGVSLVIVVFLHWWNYPQKQTPRTPVSSPQQVRASKSLCQADTSIHVNLENSPYAGESSKKVGCQEEKEERPQLRRPRERRSQHANTSFRDRSQRPTQRINPPPLRTKVRNTLHEFCHWHDVEASLFRVYTVAEKEKANEAYSAVPAYNPSSQRGTVKLVLRVKNSYVPNNSTQNSSIEVYWVDYKGKEVSKGTIEHGHTWTQTTWIDHPWVFRANGKVLLHFIPYRIIPSTSFAVTTEPDDPRVGTHSFSICSSLDPQKFACQVEDPIFPYPARDFINTTTKAIESSLNHCIRLNFNDWDLLARCGMKILTSPSDERYRSFRIANKVFGPRLWTSPARGVLLAGGFYENLGFVQFGNSLGLSINQNRELSQWVVLVQQWKEKSNEEMGSFNQAQPMGADGYGAS